MFTKDKVILLSVMIAGLILGLLTKFLLGGTDVVSILRILFWFSLAHVPFIIFATKTKYKKNVFVPTFILVLFVIAITIIYLITSRTADSWADLIYALFIAFGSVFAVLSFFVNLFIYRKIKNQDALLSKSNLFVDALVGLLSIVLFFSYLDILGDMSISLAPAYYLFVGGFGVVLGLALFYVMKGKLHYYKIGLSALPMLYVFLFHMEGIQYVSTVLVSSLTALFFALLSQLNK